MIKFGIQNNIKHANRKYGSDSLDEMDLVNMLTAPIDKECTLKQFLTSLTKYELNTIRKNLELKKASAISKPDLVSVLDTGIKENLKLVLRSLGGEEYHLLTKAANKNGMIKGIEISPFACFRLRQWGAAFSGVVDGDGPFLVIPWNIAEDIKTLSNDINFVREIKKRHKWINVSTGVLYYYGVMYGYELHEAVQALIGEDIDPYEYFSYLYRNVGNGREIKLSDGLLHNIYVHDPNNIYKEQQARKGTGFVPLTLDEALSAPDCNYMDSNKSHSIFYEFLLNTYDITSYRAFEIVEESICMMRNNHSMDEVIEYMQTVLEVPNPVVLQEVKVLLDEIYISTNMWVLKGNTILDMKSK